MVITIVAVMVIAEVDHRDHDGDAIRRPRICAPSPPSPCHTFPLSIMYCPFPLFHRNSASRPRRTSERYRLLHNADVDVAPEAEANSRHTRSSSRTSALMPSLFYSQPVVSWRDRYETVSTDGVSKRATHPLRVYRSSISCERSPGNPVKD